MMARDDGFQDASVVVVARRERTNLGRNRLSLRSVGGRNRVREVDHVYALGFGGRRVLPGRREIKISIS